jgi:hypothetical protein
VRRAVVGVERVLILRSEGGIDLMLFQGGAWTGSGMRVFRAWRCGVNVFMYNNFDLSASAAFCGYTNQNLAGQGYRSFRSWFRMTEVLDHLP